MGRWGGQVRAWLQLDSEYLVVDYWAAKGGFRTWNLTFDFESSGDDQSGAVATGQTAIGIALAQPSPSPLPYSTPGPPTIPSRFPSLPTSHHDPIHDMQHRLHCLRSSCDLDQQPATFTHHTHYCAFGDQPVSISALNRPRAARFATMWMTTVAHTMDDSNCIILTQATMSASDSVFIDTYPLADFPSPASARKRKTSSTFLRIRHL